MNFEQWKKLSKRQQKEIAQNWDVRKDEGRDIAEAVLNAFIKKYGSNKSFQISDEIVRGNSRWAISVRCLDDSVLPKNFMGITVGWHYVGHIDDGVSFKEIPEKVWRRFVASRPSRSASK